MKKIALLFLAVSIGIGAFAQYQAGNILLTGTLILGGGTTVDDHKTTTIEIGPGVEYFFTDKISFGGQIDYSLQKEVDDDPGGGFDKVVYKSTMTTISPYAAMYFINEERFALFCRLGFGFGFGKDVNENTVDGTTISIDEKHKSFEIGLKPGIAVHLTEKFGMTATIGALGFHSDKTEHDNVENKSSEYGLKLTPSLGFGLYFKLR